jgi:hypothetical protein
MQNKKVFEKMQYSLVIKALKKPEMGDAYLNITNPYTTNL